MFTKISIFKYSQLQEKLIQNSLSYVYKYGWSDNAIHAACALMDLSPACHRLVKPYDLISYSMKKWNKNSLRTIDDNNFNDNKRIHQKIHYAIKIRLSEQLQYIDTWNEAMAIGAHPDNILETKQLLWDYSDEVWHRCGDRSTDYNYYTKRVLFNTAYAATELHLLSDQSINKNASWEFLDRRLQDILHVGKTINQIKTVGGAAIEGAWSLLEMFKQPQRKDMRQPISELQQRKEIKEKIQKVKQQQQ